MKERDPLAALAIFALVIVIAIVSAATKNDSFRGIISGCGSPHAAMGSDAESCTEAGAHYELVLGRIAYPLQGDEPQLKKLAGREVTIVGKVDDDEVLRVSSVFAQKQ